MPNTLYAARAWLFLGGQRKSFPTLDGRSREGVRASIGELYAMLDAERGGVARADICVELFLPHELFEDGLDQCRVEIPSGLGEPRRVPIGELHPLVLRWNDRAVTGGLLGDLERRYRRLSEHARFPCEIPRYTGVSAPCAWVDPTGGKEPNALLTTVSADNELVLCLLTSEPRDSALGALHELLMAGIPAMLWSRTPKQSKKRLEQLVKDRAPDELRGQVFATRRDCDHPLRRHLSLLWENPARMPPPPQERPLRAASKRGAK